MVSQDNNDFQYWFNQLVEDISYSEDDSLNDYLKWTGLILMVMVLMILFYLLTKVTMIYQLPYFIQMKIILIKYHFFKIRKFLLRKFSLLL